MKVKIIGHSLKIQCFYIQNFPNICLYICSLAEGLISYNHGQLSVRIMTFSYIYFTLIHAVFYMNMLLRLLSDELLSLIVRLHINTKYLCTYMETIQYKSGCVFPSRYVLFQWSV